MRSTDEIPSVIQEPYQNIKFEFLKKLNKLSNNALKNDVVITKLKIEMFLQMTRCFEQSFITILNAMNTKKSADSLQDVYDNFTIWNNIIQNFKRDLMSENDFKNAKASSGKFSINVLSHYEINLAKLDLLVKQIKSLIFILENTFNKHLPLSIKQFKQKLSDIINEKEFRSLLTALSSNAKSLKFMPLLEVESSAALFEQEYETSQFQTEQSDIDTTEPDSERRLSDSNSSTISYDSDTDSALHKSQEIPPVVQSAETSSKGSNVHISKSSTWVPAKPALQTNRDEITTIQNTLNELVKRIASTNSANKLVIRHLENRVSKLANTDELKQYCAQREKYWSNYFKDKTDNSLTTKIHKPPTDK